ncbi:SDR family NAD(P)-dependent oxidoreductase [Oceaniglobus ichthyenteri]|uniref:SDR family NAD(P)-dependent oxidoreductase n=1 Tax=Oceaniglobus ichthyenteri TaxID=2136177 RepID=UPI000D354E87|nr:SDR family NAD(P)-dependent oxidoreductase [Oceaniglobus ichthyenteri]
MDVLITGANRGIGAALLADYRASGYAAQGTARNDPALLPLDVSDPASVRALAKSLGNTPLPLLVCNAGIYLDKGHDLTAGFAPDLWGETFAVNVTGVFLTIQALLPNIRAARGKIAIISSQMASQELAPGGSYIYRASKAAALNLGRNLATDLKSEGIAVGIYHPGWVQTDMGGESAAVTPQDAARGLRTRFDALSPATTGCFETWDGRAHPL